MMTIPNKVALGATVTATSVLLATAGAFAVEENPVQMEELKAVTGAIPGSIAPPQDDVKAVPGAPAEEIVSDKPATGANFAEGQPSDDIAAGDEVDKEHGFDRLAGSPDPHDYDPAPYYAQGLTALKAKRYQEALDCFNRALKIDPNFFKASFQKAVVFQVTGYPEHAIKRYEQLVKYHPEMAEAHINLGSLYRDRDKIRAEAEFRKAIEIYYYSLPAHYNLANLLLDMGRYEEAMNEYKACLKFNRKTAFIRNNMGVIFQKKKYYEEAAEQFAMACKLSPKNKIFSDNLKMAKKHLAAQASAGRTH
jgi:tetratricopeptide (TPR) repeat protein